MQAGPEPRAPGEPSQSVCGRSAERGGARELKVGPQGALFKRQERHRGTSASLMVGAPTILPASRYVTLCGSA